jgi:hypothetical protein
MPLRINNNIAALNARRNMNANLRDQGVRLERLSSDCASTEQPTMPPDCRYVKECAPS